MAGGLTSRRTRLLCRGPSRQARCRGDPELHVPAVRHDNLPVSGGWCSPADGPHLDRQRIRGEDPGLVDPHDVWPADRAPACARGRHPGAFSLPAGDRSPCGPSVSVHPGRSSRTDRGRLGSGHVARPSREGTPTAGRPQAPSGPGGGDAARQLPHDLVEAGRRHTVQPSSPEEGAAQGIELASTPGLEIML